MPRTVDPMKAEELAHIDEDLDDAALFRNVVRAAARARVLKENKTLRRYLGLLVQGCVSPHSRNHENPAHSKGQPSQS
jgi:hypothetical protein